MDLSTWGKPSQACLRALQASLPSPALWLGHVRLTPHGRLMLILRTSRGRRGESAVLVHDRGNHVLDFTPWARASPTPVLEDIDAAALVCAARVFVVGAWLEGRDGPLHVGPSRDVVFCLEHVTKVALFLIPWSPALQSAHHPWPRRRSAHPHVRHRRGSSSGSQRSSGLLESAPINTASHAHFFARRLTAGSNPSRRGW